MLLKKLGFVVAALFLASVMQWSAALAQDTCSDVLKDIKNIEVYESIDFKKRYYANVLFNQSYKESSSEEGAKMEAMWKTITGQMKYNRSNFDIARSSYHESNLEDTTELSTSFSMKQILSSEGLRAWENCMLVNRNPLYIRPVADSTKSYEINVKSLLSASNTIKVKKISIEGAARLSGDKPKKITNTLITLKLIVDNPKKEVNFTIHGKSRTGDEVVNTIHIPRLPPPHDLTIQEIYNVAKFPADVVTATYTDHPPPVPHNITETLTITEYTVTKTRFACSYDGFFHAKLPPFQDEKIHFKGIVSCDVDLRGDKVFFSNFRNTDTCRHTLKAWKQIVKHISDENGYRYKGLI